MNPRIHDHEADIAQLVSQLAVAEAARDNAAEARKAKEEELKAELAPLKEAEATQQSVVDELRAKIKERGLLVDKDQLHPALSVVQETQITYDPAAMFQWCVMFNPSLLELKDANITQHVNWILSRDTQKAKYFGSDGRKPLVPMPVTVEKVATIHFKGNLSPWLPPIEAEPEPEKAPDTAPEAEKAVQPEQAVAES